MKSKSIRRLLWILFSTSFLFACGSGQEKRAEGGPVVSGVRLETVHLQPTPVFCEAVGTIRSATTSVLAAQLSGTVREIRVRAGDGVKRGQILAVLDDRSPRAQLDAAQAGVSEVTQGLAEAEQGLQAAVADRQFAEATYRRYQGLLAKNSVSRQEFEGVEARYKAAAANERALEAKKRQIAARAQQARSQQESAQTFFSYSRVVSPLDGVVTAKAVDVGTVVMPGTPLLTVETTARYRLEASLPEQYLPKVSVGQTMTVSTEQGNLEGRVAEIVPAADVASRTFLVKVDLPRDCACPSGEYGKARFRVGEAKCLAVPHGAVVEHGELQGVFVLNARGAVEYRLVKTGRDLGERVEILSGLADGEQVAISQVDRLGDGARVEEL
jgi:RND family efflux transporter MFP subunit